MNVYEFKLVDGRVATVAADNWPCALTLLNERIGEKAAKNNSSKLEYLVRELGAEPLLTHPQVIAIVAGPASEKRMRKLLVAVRDAAAQRTASDQAFVAAIRAAREAGESLANIAVAAGLTAQRIHQITQ